MRDIYESRKMKRRRPPRFELIAGVLCLDFVNTLDDRFSGEPKELLKHYVDLARFGEDTGILPTERVDHLFELSYTAPETAQRALEAAIELREVIFVVVWALIEKKPVPATALILLNQYIQDAAQHLNLIQTGSVQRDGPFEWRFDDAPNNMEAPLWPIAHSAAELLASNQTQFIRACDSKACQWLFLDTSKSHRRRWCDMTTCGNRAKVLRFYKRKRKAGLAKNSGAAEK